MTKTAEARSAEPSKLIEALAHELRQPLSAIESTAYYLTMALPRGERRAQEHALGLQRFIEQANWILSCAVQLADTSPISPQLIDLEELITQIVAARTSDGGAPVQLHLAGDLPLLGLDPGRARHLVESLLAMMTRGTYPKHMLRVYTSRGGGVDLEFAIDLPEPSPEGCFGAGASLGLESAQRIAELHGGSFETRFGVTELDPAGAARVRITFPPAVAA
jgi:signal transduction histidine kinase